MSVTEAPGGIGCIGCITAPAAQGKGEAAAEDEIVLAVPAADCAACIPELEEGLAGFPGIRDVRVNLSLRRLRVRHDGTLTPERLIPEVARLGYEALPLDLVALSGTENDRVGRDLLMRLGVAFFAMMNVMLLSVAVWSGADGVTRDIFHLISGAIAIPTVLFSGQPFFRSAWAGVKRGRLGMDFPISLALVLASSISVYESFHGGDHAYFDAAVMLTFFLLGGRYLDHRTRAAARSAAQELAALEVPRAIRLTTEGSETVNVADLAVGDLISVRPGARVPADGIVTEGESELDRSLLTGESLPARAVPGGVVSAGEVNLTGPLTVRVTAAGKDSSLSRIAALVAVAEEARSRYTSIADRAARAYSPLVHTLSFSAFAFWMWRTGGDLRFAINISAATLIITCPCALGLAVPAVVTAASGKLFRKGLLIKSGTALERMAAVDTVVFDKTGTLTLGAPEPLDLGDHDADDLRVALALAQGSSHPLAQALAQRALGLGIRPAHVTEVREVPGHGIEGVWQDQRVRLGRADWVGAEAGDVTATTLRIGGQEPVTFAFADALRPGAEGLVAALSRQGMELHLVSGDVAGAVEGLAQRLGVPAWTAGAKPEEKAAYVRALTQRGRKVLMVGDGLNDTAALAEALVSVSPASALDAARAASDIVLLGRDLSPVEDALRISRQAVKRMRENFALSAAYNVVSVPVALIGLATPLLAALAMSLSSVTVTLNALRLK
ncbi:Type cbb3 cytochrome oxidase biogenesis protein CcoI, Copper-translocating P-type ATPase [Rubellimicrobium mesophilum DSM 19309]|uniref:Type cbb3 cytochrome oxidase biogenesis protein CcoI, Copper-translocating P-type ATPase n=1 Tax=Rubellimicrobium mesophilum DSM 19309 TaxID=442562 RepID=A0A017HMF7_9RHOB|nr:heavy metal translocating P-type ATPase [Rubellimicrobium mesophilum]EYD75682.1 Type cbb3 cytochrome oxidase biogenesis protein CcoI, Copper-translocating P-type ATPase [Rubellimicrobium mesophilum DSM 19309]